MTPIDLMIRSGLDPKGFDMVSKHIASIGESIRTGLGIDVGRRLLSGLQEIPIRLQSAVAVGLEFNETLETAKIGVGGVLRQFRPEEFRTFTDALTKAGEAVQELKIKALDAPGKFQELVTTFQAIVGPASRANIALRDQINLVVLMSQTLSGIGIRRDQLIQESRALLTGDINQDAQAAKILNITRADILAATEAGRLYEFLRDKMNGFSEAAKVGAQSMSTLRSNMEDAFEQQLAAAAEELFEVTKAGLRDLTASMNTPEFQTGLRDFLALVTKATAAVLALGAMGAANLNYLTTAALGMASAVTVVGAATAAITGFNMAMAAAFGAGAIKSVADMGTALVLMGGGPVSALAALNAGLVALGATLWTGVEAWRAWKAGKEEALSQEELGAQNEELARLAANLLAAKQGMREISEELAAQLAQQLDAAAEAASPEIRSDAIREVLKQLRAAQPQMLPEVVVTADEVLKDNQQLLDEINRQYREATQSQVEIATAQYEEKKRQITAEIHDHEDKAIALTQAAETYQARLTALRQEEFDADDKHLQELIRLREEAAAKELEIHRQKLQHELQADGEQLRRKRDDIAIRQAMLEADFRRTDVSKRPERLKLLEEEIAALDRVIAKMREKHAAERDPAAKESINQQMIGFEGERRGLEVRRAGFQNADPNSVGQQFTATITDIQNQFGTVAQQMAGAFQDVFMGAINTISNGITGLIMGTLSWGQALQQIGMTILTSIVQAIVQMAVRWIATQLLMAVAGKAMQAAMVAAMVPLAIASSVMWAAPATLATIATGGGAAVAAPGIIAGSKALVMAQSLTGFKSGGWTGDGSPDEVAGVAHNREFYFSAPQTSRWGRGNLEALARGDVSGVLRAARAGEGRNGIAGQAQPDGRNGTADSRGGPMSTPASRPLVHLAVLNNLDQMRQFLESAEGEKVVVDLINRRRLDVGLNT